MIRIVHLSDLHISRHPAKNGWVRAVVNEVYNRYFAEGTDTWLLVTGDITDDGFPGQYQQAADILQGFNGRLLLCPGNHDYAIVGTFFEVQGAIQNFDQTLCAALHAPGPFGPRVPVVTTFQSGADKVRLIGLNSVLVQAPPVTLALGHIGHDQLAQLNTLLSEPNAPPTIVYLHHRPEPCDGIDGALGRALLDKSQFLEVVGNRAEVIAFGHDGGPTEAALGLLFQPSAEGPIHVNANHCLSGQGSCVVIFVDGSNVEARYVNLEVQ